MILSSLAFDHCVWYYRVYYWIIMNHIIEFNIEASVNHFSLTLRIRWIRCQTRPLNTEQMWKNFSSFCTSQQYFSNIYITEPGQTLRLRTACHSIRECDTNQVTSVWWSIRVLTSVPIGTLFKKPPTFHHAPEPLDILVGVEEDTLWQQPISARPARLLVISLHRLRQGVVDHKPNVRLVNTHTKCYCGANHLKMFLSYQSLYSTYPSPLGLKYKKIIAMLLTHLVNTNCQYKRITSIAFRQNILKITSRRLSQFFGSNKLNI